MRTFVRISVASLLLAVFGVFTVGLPIVRYLCPMMNEDSFACPYSPQSGTKGVTVTNELPSCCASYIVAERNQTPYTSVQNDHAQPLQILTIAAVDDVIGLSQCSPVAVSFSSNVSPPINGEPLYILPNSLLI